MAWKQDLAKLKQKLGPEDAAPAPKPVPKPAPKPERPSSLDDEDAVFLSAMGLKAAAPKPDPRPLAPPAGPTASPAQAPGPQVPATAEATPSPAPAAPETFEEALRDLKGLKPLATGLPTRPSKPATPRPAPAPKAMDRPATPPPPDPAPRAASESAAPTLPPPPPDPAPAPPPLPVRFQLAAGMALEVDGMLDLRGHSPEDAIERLKDRLGDGLVLGWRSLQVLLGPDPRLHEGLLALLASGETPMVARYAQAPVPMGGSQAWLLYFAAPTAQS